jgi:hypothetical protein
VGAGVYADIVAQLQAAKSGDTSPVRASAYDLEADNNNFDTKAYSLMHNHFLHTRTSTTQNYDFFHNLSSQRYTCLTRRILHASVGVTPMLSGF